MRLTKQTKGDYHMKLNTTDKAIVSLAVIILAIAAILYSVQPHSTAGADSTAGTPAQQVHYFPRWAESRPAMQNDVQSSLIGDCLADRVTGDLYPQPDPYCLPVPSVAVVEQAKEREQDTSVIVDVPATPEPPAVEPPVIVPTQEPPVVTPPVVEPEQPETPATEEPAGNPGNLKDVGNAGENPNGRGTMDNDNAGGNGNGEHGNQGEGGHNNG
jgi:hypothetical protein